MNIQGVKKVVLVLALLSLAPMNGWADCDYGQKNQQGLLIEMIDTHEDGGDTKGDSFPLFNHVRLIHDAGIAQTSDGTAYSLFDTGQIACNDENGDEINCPGSVRNFSGWDAQYAGIQFSDTDNGDARVTNHVTVLIWQKAPSDSKNSRTDASACAESLSLAGYDDRGFSNLKKLLANSDFESGRPNIDFTLVSSAETKQQQYGSSNSEKVGTTHDEMDSAVDVNVFTIDTQGNITGISRKMVEMLPWSSWN